ncbi:MAG: hypothetical protein ABL961_12180 [Vicinamibacterales bacterium]
MTWPFWIVVATLVTAAAAVTGIKPKGTRHIAHTSMMGMARIALVVVVIILAFVALRAMYAG